MEEKILVRIRKMMAIANDSAATEEERDTALQMSYRLLAKHNLSMLQVEASSEEPRDTYKTEGWSQIWAKHVCMNIAELFFCRYYYGRKINATKCIHNFVGRESNATTAMLMSSYVINSILKEGRRRYTHNLSPETRSFALGCVANLRTRIKIIIAEAQKENESSTPGTALVLVNLYKTEQEANAMLLPKLKPSARGKNEVTADAYNAGHQFADSINLSKQINATQADYKQLK